MIFYYLTVVTVERLITIFQLIYQVTAPLLLRNILQDILSQFSRNNYSENVWNPKKPDVQHYSNVIDK